jgi:DNA-binding transcriptional MerR regulator
MSQPDHVQAPSQEPLYNIGAVTRMTGIPMATLRIWERRYGFPHSARTAGGHRLYSERDVASLRWIKARGDEGMQAGQAVRALQHLEREGRFPEVPMVTPISVTRTTSEPSLPVLRERLTGALLAHDTDKADQILGEAMATLSWESIILQAIVPMLGDIGQAWTEGRVNVATEHLATHYVRHRLIMWTMSGPPVYPIRPVLLACAPGELHEGGLLILGVLLRRRRWPVAYLGQSVPLTDLASLIQETKPPTVALVAAMEPAAQALAEWPRYLPGVLEARHPVITFGGHIFTEQPEWRARVPGVFLGATLQEGVDTLERTLRDATSLMI